MATKAILHCKRCSEEFPIYWSDAKHEAIYCPNCKAKINENLVEQILCALGTIHDINHEILKAHLEHGDDLFEVSVYHSAYPDYD